MKIQKNFAVLKILLAMSINFLKIQFVCAQDTIYTKAGEVIVGQIVAISETQINYIKSQNVQAQNSILDKKEISLIKFAQKSKENFLMQEHAASKTESEGIENGISNFPISFCNGEYQVKYFLLDNKKVDEVLKLKNNTEINSLIGQSHKRRTIARVLTYSAIPCTFFYFMTALKTNSEFLGPVLMLSSPLFFSGGIILRINSKSKRREAVDLYNKTYFNY